MDSLRDVIHLKTRPRPPLPQFTTQNPSSQIIILLLLNLPVCVVFQFGIFIGTALHSVFSPSPPPIT